MNDGHLRKLAGKLALVAAMGAMLAACGGSGAAPKPKTTAGQKVTITFWNEMTGPYQVALNGVIAAFETQNPQITVDSVVVPNDAALQPKLLTAVVGHDLPTISQLNPYWGPEFISTKSLVNLTPDISKASNFGLGEFYGRLLAAGRWPGNKQYLLPFNVSDCEMFYNQSAFQAAGITSPPATWSAFAADAAKLSTGSHHAFAITLVHSYPWRAFFNEAGGQFATASGQPNRSAFAPGGAGVAAMSFWQQLVNKGQAVLTQGYASQTDFANGTSSILVGTSAFYPYLVPAVAGKFKIGIAPMPSGKITSTSVFGGYLGMFSQASPAQQAAGFKFIQYLTSKQGQLYWMEHSNGYLPVRADAAAAGKSFLATHPAQETALKSLADATPEPQYAWYDQFDIQDLIPGIQAVLIGKSSPTAEMSALYGDAKSLAKSSS